MAPRHLKTKPHTVSKRALILLVSLCLLFTSVVGGTYAWLFIDGTGSSTSSFVGTTVSVTISNSTAETGRKVVPGEYVTMSTGTLASGSQASYIFARLDRGSNYSTGFNQCMTYTLASGWTQTTSGQYTVFTKTDSVAAGTGNLCPFSGNRVTVNVSTTKETIAGLPDFTFSIQYAAVQAANLTNAATALANSGLGW